MMSYVLIQRKIFGWVFVGFPLDLRDCTNIFLWEVLFSRQNHRIFSIELLDTVTVFLNRA